MATRITKTKTDAIELSKASNSANAKELGPSVQSVNKELLLYNLTLTAQWIDYALSELNYGRWDQSEYIKRIILTDSKLKAVIEKRIDLVFKSKLQCVSKRAKDQKDCNIINKILAKSEQELRLAYLDYLLHGVGLTQLVWDYYPDMPNDYTPRMFHYDPWGLRYDMTNNILFLISSNTDLSEEERNKEIKEIEERNGNTYYAFQKNLDVEDLRDNRKWLTFKRSEDPRRQGLLIPLARDYLYKQTMQENMIQWSEKQAGIIYKFFVPNRSEQSSSKSAANTLKQLQKYSVVSLPRGTDESMSYDLDIIQPTNEAVWSAFADQIARVDTSYSILLLGNNLTTEVTQGALASTESHTDMQEELGKSDRQTYVAFLNSQLIQSWKEVTTNNNFEGEIVIQEDKTPEVNDKLTMLSNITLMQGELNKVGYSINIEKLLAKLDIDFVDQLEQPIEETQVEEQMDEEQ